jgi:hypothetical protein
MSLKGSPNVRVTVSRNRISDTLDWSRVHFSAANRGESLRAVAEESRHHPAELFQTEISDQQLVRWYETLCRWLIQAARAAEPAFANSYHAKNGWQNGHVETTGYTIPTALQAARHSANAELHGRALRAAEWLLQWKSSEGAFAWFHPLYGYQALVFDNCAVLQGLIESWRAGKDDRFLDAARGVARWVISLQAEDGSWVRGSYKGLAHSYYTRAAWPLLQLAEITSDDKVRHAAVKHIDWAVSNIDIDGFPRKCGFESDDALTHTIAYFIEGLLEASEILGETRYADVARATLDQVLRQFSKLRFMPGEFRPGWEANTSFTCLPGNAQLALCCIRSMEQTGKAAYGDSAMRLLRANCAAPTLDANDAASNGVRASYPVTGDYLPLHLPLWGAKFSIDAILAADRLGLLSLRSAG